MVNLSKGGNVNLSKEAAKTTGAALTRVIAGLCWDKRATDGSQFDADASAFLVKSDGKVRSDNDLIFYGKLTADDGSVQHSGDNRDGSAEGDDERITIDLTKVSADVARVIIAVTIHEAEQRKQNFGQISKASVRVLNADGEAELAKYDLSEDASTETAMVFGEFYRAEGSDWKFKAVGQGFAGGLKSLCQNFGVNVG